MRIREIYSEKAQQLDEASLRKTLKRAAVAGALGAGILGTSSKLSTPGIGTDTVDKMFTVSQPPLSPELPHSMSAHAPPLKPDFIPAPEMPDAPVKFASKNPPGVHPTFPDTLLNQPKISGQERVNNFINHFLPLIDSTNDEILRNRRRLITLIRHDREWTAMDGQWLQYQMEKYQVDNLRDLLQRMDIVPRSMSLAQAAVESGWGTSDLARKGNAFYGQKAWSSTSSIAGGPGEKYSAFMSAKDSVAAYIHNLNTHPAYEGFRKQREELRNKQKTLSGFLLIGQLGKYSTEGPNYIRYIRNVMSTPEFKHLDDAH